MNRRGSIGSVALVALVSIAYFIFGMIIYQFLKPVIDASRTALACTSPTSWGDMGVCLIVGATIPLVIITVLSIAGGIITEKMIK